MNIFNELVKNSTTSPYKLDRISAEFKEDKLDISSSLPADSGASATATRRLRVALKTASLVRVERTLAATTPTKPSSPHRAVASALSLQKLSRKPCKNKENLL